MSYSDGHDRAVMVRLFQFMRIKRKPLPANDAEARKLIREFQSTVLYSRRSIVQ